ncbi:transglutaminase-like domain-containing protein [Novipirellula aureliae]|uniref:transglutaminase-like domain-containing protein n=1 Tax=Novipirellula aureliae TaxID=2527966 RepID=UPI001E5F9288|nr:transglutaminase family protein [Novipirellula aureliae]
MIDSRHPDIAAHASMLISRSPIETVRKAFAFVRDEVRHSSDCKIGPVTYRASDVLRERVGYCYAKSHLLAAILRANNIPTGLCYQRIAMNADATSFCLHGLNAVFLPDCGWYRLDPRGNRDNIDAQFDPPNEKLAFTLTHPQEYDVPGIFVDPLPSVIQCLVANDDWADAYANLPDASCHLNGG